MSKQLLDFLYDRKYTISEEIKDLKKEDTFPNSEYADMHKKLIDRANLNLSDIHLIMEMVSNSYL